MIMVLRWPIYVSTFYIQIHGRADLLRDIVSDETRLQRLADEFAASGWAPTVRDGAFYAEFSAPSAGPPPWELYEVKPTTIFGLGTTEPFGATRWRF